MASSCSRWACFILPDRTAQNRAFRATKARSAVPVHCKLFSEYVELSDSVDDLTDYGHHILILTTLLCILLTSRAIDDTNPVILFSCPKGLGTISKERETSILLAGGCV